VQYTGMLDGQNDPYTLRKVGQGLHPFMQKYIVY